MTYTTDTLTVGDYFEAISAGDIAEPVFQSPPRWDDKTRANYVLCVETGRISPALIFCRIADPTGGPDVILRLDGNQRTAALAAEAAALKAVIDAGEAAAEPAADADKATQDAYKATQADAENAAALLEILESAPLITITVNCPDISDAARLFVDLNAGVRLSAVQKAKALLPPEIQRAEDDAAEILLTAYTGKFGRTDAGTAAGLLLAALIDNSRASSNSNSANIVLKSTKPADLPDYKAAAQTVADIHTPGTTLQS